MRDDDCSKACDKMPKLLLPVLASTAARTGPNHAAAALTSPSVRRKAATAEYRPKAKRNLKLPDALVVEDGNEWNQLSRSDIMNLRVFLNFGSRVTEPPFGSKKNHPRKSVD